MLEDISWMFCKCSSNENKTGYESCDRDLSNRPGFVVWKKEIKDGKVVQRNVLVSQIIISLNTDISRCLYCDIFI